MKLHYRQRLLATSLLVSAGMLASPAYAQQDSSATPAAEAPPTGPVESQPLPTTNAQGEPITSTQEIVVTGSRIPQPNLQSAAPIWS